MKRWKGSRAETRFRAFSLVELLVVMAILVLIMVLALPALLRSIEAADRNRCAVNQAKLAMGMAAYDTRNGFFPGIRNTLSIKSPDGTKPGYLLRDTGGAAIQPGRFPMPASTTNWFVVILPFVGFGPVFDQVVDGRVWIANTGDFAINHPGTTQDVTTCPARAGFYDTSDGHAGKNMHYAANGAGASTNPALFNRNDGAIGDNANGVFVSMADVVASDGASTTILLSERYVGSGGTGLDKSWMPWLWTDGSRVNTLPLNWPLCGEFRSFNGDNAPLTNLRRVHPDPGGVLVIGFVSGTSAVNASTRVINTGNSSLPNSGVNISDAAHPGGVYAAFVDGSTRFLKDDLAPHVYAHLMTHRSVWSGSSYSTNSARVNTYLNALPTTTPPTTNPYTFKPGDY